MALIGISPCGAIIFISDLYSGCISDKQLTKQSGILTLLERGDSVMADRGFDNQDDLTLLGVKLNMPPFLRGKSQLDEDEMIETTGFCPGFLSDGRDLFFHAYTLLHLGPFDHHSDNVQA